MTSSSSSSSSPLNTPNTTTTSPKNKPLTEAWRTWLRINLARGCSKQVLLERCVDDEGFSRQEVEQELQMGDDTTSSLKSSSNNNDTITTKLSTTSTTSNFVNNGWKEWIRLQLDQENDNDNDNNNNSTTTNKKEELFQRLAIQEGLDMDQVSMALGGYRARHATFLLPSSSSLLSSKRPRPPFTKRQFLPRAWKVDTELVELYEIPNFLTVEECQEAIQRIDDASSSQELERSVVSYGDANSRTSRTCHLRLNDDNNDNPNDIVRRIEDKLNALMNYDDSTTTTTSSNSGGGAEPLQGQCYGPGEYFKPHCDWFSPDQEEYEKHCIGTGSSGGQRTWTVMIYLNFVPNGGGTTRFEHLGGREFVPIPGLALAWNNLDADDETPNHWTLHEAKPVTSGKKYVLTKWYRERPMILI